MTSLFRSNLRASKKGKGNRDTEASTSHPASPASSSSSSSLVLSYRARGEQGSNQFPKSSKRGIGQLPLARKIVSKIVKSSTISVIELEAHSPNDHGFDARLKLKIQALGPAKAKVSFPRGLEIHLGPSQGGLVLPQADRKGKERVEAERKRSQPPVALVQLPDIKVRPSTHPLVIDVDCKIRSPLDDATSQGISKLVRTILTEPEDSALTIRTEHARIDAYKIRFEDVVLEKQISLKGLDSLGGALQFGLGRHGGLSREAEAGSSASFRSTSATIHQRRKSELEIQGLKMIGGTPEKGIEIAATVEIENKSNVSAELGQLKLFIGLPTDPREPASRLAKVGELYLPNMSLKQGRNPISAQGFVKLPMPTQPDEERNAPSAAAVAETESELTACQRLIASLLENKAISLTAYAPALTEGGGVSTIAWISAAMDGCMLSARIPPLGSVASLLDGATLKSHQAQVGQPTKGGGLVARSTLRNGFDVDIELESLDVLVLSESPVAPLKLGEIQTPTKWDKIIMRPGEPVHVELPFQLNQDASVLVEFLRREASSRGVKLGKPLNLALDLMPPGAGGVLREGHEAEKPLEKESDHQAQDKEEEEEDLKELDLARLVAASLSSLKVSAHVKAAARIGSYQIPSALSFVQSSLPIAISSTTATAILPELGRPIVKTLMDQAKVTIGDLVVLDMDEGGLEAQADIRIHDFGPLDVELDFPDGLEVRLDLREGTEEGTDHRDEATQRRTPHARILLRQALLGKGSKLVKGGQAMGEAKNVVPIRMTPIRGGAKSMENFSRLVSLLLELEEVRVIISTDKCSVSAGGVRFLSPLSKAVSLRGLGGLKGIEVKEFKIVGEVAIPGFQGLPSSSPVLLASKPKPDRRQALGGAYLVHLQVVVDHPGSLAIKLSRMEMMIVYQGFVMGVVHIEDVHLGLKPHNRLELEAKGYIYLDETDEAIKIQGGRERRQESVGRMMSLLISGQEVAVTLKGHRAFAPSPSPSSSFSSNVPSTLTETNPSSNTNREPAKRKNSKSSVGSSNNAKSGIKRERNSSISTNSSNPSSSSSTSAEGPSRYQRRQVPWLDSAFRMFTTQTRLSDRRMREARVVKRIDVGSLDATFHKGSDDPEITVGDLTVQYQLPYPVDFQIVSVEAEVEILFQGHGVVGKADVQRTELVEAVDGDRAEEQGEGKGIVWFSDQGERVGKIKVRPSSFRLSGEASSTEDGATKKKKKKKRFEALSEMISHVLECQETDKISVRGRASASVRTSCLADFQVGIELGGKGEEYKLTIQGMRNLKTSPVQYTNLEVVDANEEFLKIVFSLYLNNPSSTVRLQLGDFGFSLAAYYRGHYVGRAHVGRGLRISGKGPFSCHDVHFRYQPHRDDRNQVRQLAADFLSGKPSQLEIRGDRDSVRDADCPILSRAIQGLRLGFQLNPIMDKTLIESVSINLGVGMLTSSKVEAKFRVRNPLGVSIQLHSLSFVANHRGEPFGSTSVLYDPHQPMTIPPGQLQQSSEIQVHLAQPLENLVTAFLDSRGEIRLDLEVSAHVRLQGFDIPLIEYRQPNLPLQVKGLGSIAKFLKVF
ncbi:hypothetical protein IE53DRAFT_386543 [Violaceomyces palustris]|uniref:Uncharacterized protein n=1 Tax=Violaceomyces palustris TaxID=1673888 RepID=A0ACD0NZC4_9BASI|nr:hypothetical protein IE53DRAFT_386543 [Violaceomyces palustris]